MNIKTIVIILGSLLTIYIVYNIFTPRPVVVYLGDSLTRGPMVNEKSRYHYRVQSNVKHDIVDLSENGLTSEGGIRVWNNFIASNPRIDVLVLALGGNDYLGGVDKDITKENLTYIVRDAIDRKITVLLVGLDPRHGRRTRDIYEEIAYEDDLIWMPDLLKNVWGNPSLKIRDNIHPNYRGHEVMAENFEPFLIEAIRRYKIRSQL